MLVWEEDKSVSGQNNMREGHRRVEMGMVHSENWKVTVLEYGVVKERGVLYDLGRMFKVHLWLSHLVQHYQY